MNKVFANKQSCVYVTVSFQLGKSYGKKNKSRSYPNEGNAVYFDVYFDFKLSSIPLPLRKHVNQEVQIPTE